MCDYDCGPSEFYVMMERKARKPHRCIECSGPIPPGVQYQRASGKSDGQLWSASTHTECALIWDLVHAILCEGKGLMIHGGLSEELHEHDETFSEYDEDSDEYIKPGFGGLLREVRDGYEAMVGQP